MRLKRKCGGAAKLDFGSFFSFLKTKQKLGQGGAFFKEVFLQKIIRISSKNLIWPHEKNFIGHSLNNLNR